MFGCGGGGGGSGQNPGSPAYVSLEVRPDRIDTGDRSTFYIRLDSIRQEGVPALLVKVLHPSGLSFVGEKGFLSIPGYEDTEILPITADADEVAYVVFFITAPSFRGSSNAEISFVMQGNYAVSNGEVSVDVDVTETDVRPLFKVGRPQFIALASTSITVLEDE